MLEPVHSFDPSRRGEHGLNPFYDDPFRPLTVDPARWDWDVFMKDITDIANAHSRLLHDSMLNKVDLINTESRKDPSYRVFNAARYETDKRLEALKVKAEALEKLRYVQGLLHKNSQTRESY